MNIFVLCTGRSGSTTLIRACRHINNYSSGHETRVRYLGAERFNYPENHIEADNRLAWMLGRLEQVYGEEAYYVHLQRNRQSTGASFARRFDHRYSIIWAYWNAVLGEATPAATPLDICLDYYDTVNANIASFLKDKPFKMEFHLENAQEDFTQFWHCIGAEGDRTAALAEWNHSFNKSESRDFQAKMKHAKSMMRRIAALFYS